MFFRVAALRKAWRIDSLFDNLFEPSLVAGDGSVKLIVRSLDAKTLLKAIPGEQTREESDWSGDCKRADWILLLRDPRSYWPHSKTIGDRPVFDISNQVLELLLVEVRRVLGVNFA